LDDSREAPLFHPGKPFWSLRSAFGVRRVEQQYALELRLPSGGQRPVLALDVANYYRARSAASANEANDLATARGREAQHMLGAIMAEVCAPLDCHQPQQALPAS